MKKVLIYISNQHDLIFKTLLIGFCIAVIAAILPRDEIQRLDYQKGRTWTGDDLYAPFDFSILKNQDSLETERNNSVSNVVPHFIVDENIRKEVYEGLNVRLSRSRSFDTSKYSYRERLLVVDTVLDRVFETGVWKLESVNDISTINNRIVLVTGRKARTVSTSDILSVSEARELAFNIAVESGDTLLGNLVAELIKSNIYYDDNLTSLIRKKAFEDISITRGLVRKGDLIISKGNIIDNSKTRILRSLFISKGNSNDASVSKTPYWQVSY